VEGVNSAAISGAPSTTAGTARGSKAAGLGAGTISPGLLRVVARATVETSFAPAVEQVADIVHTHHMRSTPGKIAALAARVRSQRLVVTDHGLQSSNWAGRLPRMFDRFLAVSAYSARELHAPPSRTRVIYGEAMATAWHLFDLLTPLVAAVTVAHAGMIKLIVQARVKSDRHDTLHLARLLARG
jgi:hypothetical protein